LQAEELAQQLATTRIDAVYCGDSTRAIQTARIVAKPHRLAVRQDARLREVNFGEWEGLTREEINERYAGACDQWEACKRAEPTGGETDAEMAERVLQALHEIVVGHGDEHVLVVTSGGPIIAAEAHVRCIDQDFARLQIERPANGEVREIHLQNAQLWKYR
jgi:broad specificity phosphatase PhoE